MPRKYANDSGKEWNKPLPYLLLVYCKVPPASTGFALFELLYGCSVREPLDILSDNWEAREMHE